MRSSWGNVREVGADTWEVRWTAGGKRHSERIHGTRKDADRRLAELRLRYEGDLGDGASATFGMFWDAVYEPHLADLKPSTARGYRSLWRARIEPAWGDVEMESVRPRDIQRWLLSLPAGVAPNAKSLMGSIYSLAVVEGVVESNPMRNRYRMPRDDGSGRRENSDVLGRDELEDIYMRCEGEWWRPLYVLAAFGGLRRAECCGTRMEDVSGMDGWAVVEVRRGIQFIDGELIEVPPKTGERVALVEPAHAGLLLEHAGEDGWLVDDLGCPPNPDRLSASWRRWLSDQPVRGVPWRNLRNSYATMMAAEGHSAELVSKLLGHSQAVDYSHYNRPDASALIRGMEG